MTITQTMENIFGLLERHCPKYMTPVDVGTVVKPTRQTRKTLPPSDVKKALAMRKQGYSYEEIAASFGCAKSNIWRIINRR